MFAMGDLMFYGRENAEKRGITRFYYRAYGSENAKDDPFALHLDRNEQLTECTPEGGVRGRLPETRASSRWDQHRRHNGCHGPLRKPR